MGLIINQGDIYLVHLDPVVGHEIAKTRPCIVLQNNVYNEKLGTIIVVPLTSTMHDTSYANIVRIHTTDSSLKREGSAKLEQIRCVDKSRFERKIGKVAPHVLVSLRRSLALVVGTYSVIEQ